MTNVLAANSTWLCTTRTEVALLLALTVMGSLYLVLSVIFSTFALGINVGGGVLVYLSAFLALVVAYLSVPLQGAGMRSSPGISGFPKGVDVFVLLLSILAVVSLFYDRQVLRGIDYFSVGMAQARSMVNASGASGSFFSLFGNLFSYGFLIVLINLLLQWEERSRLFRVATVLGISFVALFLSFLMGGRTVLLITLGVMFASLLGRNVLGRDFLPRGIGWGGVTVVCGATFLFFGLVFFLRNQAFGAGGSADYLENICIHLISFDRTLGSSCDLAVTGHWWEDLFNYANAVFLYAFHTAWVSESVYQGNLYSGDTSVLLAGLNELFLKRLGGALESHPYAGFFVPAPAAVLHDLGWLGVLGVFFITGVLLKVATFRLLQGGLWVGRFGFVIMVSSLMLGLLISPANLPGYVLFLACIVIFFLGYGFYQVILLTVRERF